MATIKEVAQLAGVSVATVSRVLNRKTEVSPELESRVRLAVEELNYHPHRVARSLRVQTGQIVGLIISDIQNFFFTAVVRGVEDVAYEHGYTLLLCNSDEHREKERLYIDTMLAENVAGVIITPVAETDNYCHALLANGVPVVAMDRRMRDLDVDTVIINNVEGAYEATRHLIRLGHRRIGFIGGPLCTTTGRERIEGYRKALAEHGMPVDLALIKISDFKQGGGYQSTRELLEMDASPTAIFAGNNLMTLGALNAIHEKNLRVPEGVAVVGFDDMPWASSLAPPLTTVSQPTYELGSAAGQLLLQRIADRKRQVSEITLEPKLIVRSSCGYRQSEDHGAGAGGGG